MDQDPTVTDPDLYKMIYENDRVRVLEYRDKPGDQTHLHRHPDSIMYTPSSFRRRLLGDGRQVDIELQAGQVRCSTPSSTPGTTSATPGPTASSSS